MADKASGGSSKDGQSEGGASNVESQPKRQPIKPSGPYVVRDTITKMERVVLPDDSVSIAPAEDEKRSGDD